MLCESIVSEARGHLISKCEISDVDLFCRTTVLCRNVDVNCFAFYVMWLYIVDHF